MYFHFVLLYRVAFRGLWDKRKYPAKKKTDNVEMLLFLLNLIKTRDLPTKYLNYVPLSFSFWLPNF
jgi:hypothetical protein